MATSGSIILALNQSAALSLDWQVKSVNMGGNYSVISWALKAIQPSQYALGLNDLQYSYSIAGYSKTGTVSSITSPTTIDSGSATIVHSADGKGFFDFAISCSWQIDIFGRRGENSTSGTRELEPLPIPIAIIDAPDFNDEQNPTITYESTELPLLYKSLQAAISLTGATDDIAYRAITLNGSSYTFNLTTAERNILRNAIGREGRIPARFYIKTTFADNSVSYKYKTVELSLINYTPTLSPSVKDINARTVALTGNSSKFIKGFSNAQFTVGATARKGASIEYRTIRNGARYLDDYTSDTGTMNAIESNTFYFSATDSRGVSVNGFKTVELIPYFKLTSALSTVPMTANGALTFTIKGKYYNGSFGAKNNTLEVEYSIRDSSGNYVGNTESGWIPLGTVTPTVNDGNYTYSYTITGLSHTEQYELTVNAIDELTPVQTTSTTVVATPVFDWGYNNFHHHTDVYFDKDIYINNQTLDNYIEGKIADYVIEQGATRDWTYRKWNSGRVDLVGTTGIYQLACNNALGGWYRTMVLQSPDFPFPIINPRVTVNYESDGYGALVWATTKTSTSKPFDFYLIRPTSSASITGTVTYNVSGAWRGVG